MESETMSKEIYKLAKEMLSEMNSFHKDDVYEIYGERYSDVKKVLEHQIAIYEPPKDGVIIVES